MLNNIKTKQSGFTIVELLIVIVVIAILAAITIVAYNGIQNRSKASASVSAANTLVKKAEAANAAGSVGYPSTVAEFNAQQESSLTGSGLTLGTPTSTNTPSTVSYEKCSTPANTNGARIGYWNYAATGAAITYINVGTSCTAWSATLTGSF